MYLFYYSKQSLKIFLSKSIIYSTDRFGIVKIKCFNFRTNNVSMTVIFPKGEGFETSN